MGNFLLPLETLFASWVLKQATKNDIVTVTKAWDVKKEKGVLARYILVSNRYASQCAKKFISNNASWIVSETITTINAITTTFVETSILEIITLHLVIVQMYIKCWIIAKTSAMLTLFKSSSSRQNPLHKGSDDVSVTLAMFRNTFESRIINAVQTLIRNVSEIIREHYKRALVNNGTISLNDMKEILKSAELEARETTTQAVTMTLLGEKEVNQGQEINKIDCFNDTFISMQEIFIGDEFIDKLTTIQTDVNNCILEKCFSVQSTHDIASALNHFKDLTYNGEKLCQLLACSDHVKNLSAIIYASLDIVASRNI